MKYYLSLSFNLRLSFISLTILIFPTNDLLCEKIKLPFHISNPQDSPLLNYTENRKNSYPLFSPNVLEFYADFTLDKINLVIETDDLFDGCVTFIDQILLKEFYEKVLPKIHNKVVIVSTLGEPFFQEVCPCWDNYYLSKDHIPHLYATHPKVLAYFSKNLIHIDSKCFCLPLGCPRGQHEYYPFIQKEIKKLKHETFFRKKPIEMYINMSVCTHISRRAAVFYWQRQKGIRICKRKLLKSILKICSTQNLF